MQCLCDVQLLRFLLHLTVQLAFRRLDHCCVDSDLMGRGQKHQAPITNHQAQHQAQHQAPSTTPSTKHNTKHNTTQKHNTKTQGTRHKAQGTRHKAQGTRHKAQGTRHKAQGTRHKAQGTRHKAQGTRHTAHSTQHTARVFGSRVALTRLTSTCCACVPFVCSSDPQFSMLWNASVSSSVQDWTQCERGVRSPTPSAQ